MADRPSTDRLLFVFGTEPGEEWDLDEPDQRRALLERSFAVEMEELQLLVYGEIANQILDDDPPEAWAAVQRMLDAGMIREEVLSQVALVLLPSMQAALDNQSSWDRDAYVESLGSLPLPGPHDIQQAVLDCARASQGISVDQLGEAAIGELGRAVEDRSAAALVDRVIENLLDGFGPLGLLSGNHVVAVDGLTDGIVLTHRLGEAEPEAGFLLADFDLITFLRRRHLRLRSGEDLNVSLVDGVPAMLGPQGWLERFAAGDLLAVRVTADGEVGIEAVPSDPEADESLSERLRSAYDREVDEWRVPIGAHSLVLSLLLEDPETFAVPAAPLSELAETAGLQRRGDEVAHEESVWYSALVRRRSERVAQMLEPDLGRAREALRILAVADVAAGVEPGWVGEAEAPPSTQTLREVLEDLEDGDVCSTVALELFDSVEPGSERRAEMFIAALLEAASKPHEIATGALLSALHAEHCADPATAEAELRRAFGADRDNAVVTDRLAWYASLRGDAAGAARLWRSMEWSETAFRELQTLRSVTPPEGTVPGRNEPCWCGSGRKYKQCHLGRIERPPLADRIGWLHRKAVGYLERRSEARYTVIDVAAARAVDPADVDRFAEALEDPIVMDLVLCEGGWFDRFVEEVGDLLPEDEASLCRAWTLVGRSVFEVTAVRPGEGLTVRDRRTGDQLDVREPGFSTQATVGMLVCGRAVPDGQTHQLVGGILPVRAGSEADLLDLLDEADPVAIAEWVRRAPVSQ